MLDSNNREIRTGDFLTVSGAYFNTDNGLFLVTEASDAPDYSGDSVYLHRVKKNGELCVNRAGSRSSLPLLHFCNDAKKNRAAHEHDEKYLRYEVVDGINTHYAIEYYKEKIARWNERIASYRVSSVDWQKEEADKMRGWIDYYNAVIERLEQSDKQPKEKEKEIGIRFLMNGIKVDGGRLVPCYYGIYDDEVSISCKSYTHDLPDEYFDVVNNSDCYTDYFESDSTTLGPEHPLYKYARYVALKNIVSGKKYWKLSDEQKAEFERMKNPGQPTAADYAAIKELRKAKEDAEHAAKEADLAAERERVIREKNDGRQYIERIMEQHPIIEGEPTVTICWSEHPAFYSWDDNTLKMSVAAAEIILSHFDEVQHNTRETSDGHGWYYKTKFVIDFIDADGEKNSYEGRYDLGDNDGGLIEHIRAHGRWYRTHDEHNGQELENPPQELSDTEKFADWLEQYTENGRIVDVQIDENAIDTLIGIQQQKKRVLEEKKAQAERELQDIFDAVAMLTDEQIEAAIFCISPSDSEKIDVARFFLQELSRRDEKYALDVYRRWKNS